VTQKLLMESFVKAFAFHRENH